MRQIEIRNDTPHEVVLAYEDTRRPEYVGRISYLRSEIESVKGEKTHAADCTRVHLGAELKRLEKLLKASDDAQDELKAKNAAYRADLDALIEYESRPLPTDVDGELKRVAELNLAKRKLAASRLEFVSLAMSSKLPSLPSLHYADQALSETKALLALESDFLKFEQGFASRSFDCAMLQGKHCPKGMLPWLAVAEAEHPGKTAAKLYAIRWHFAALAHGLPRDELDLGGSSLAAE